MSGNKLNDIEAVLAHQEQQIQDLNEVVIRQGDEMDLLKKRMGKMQDRLNMLEETGGVAEGEDLSVAERAGRDKPPHY